MHDLLGTSDVKEVLKDKNNYYTDNTNSKKH